MSNQEKTSAEIMCQLITSFKADHNPIYLQTLLNILMDAQVNVPMNVSIKPNDLIQFLEGASDGTITEKQEIRMRPDFLKDEKGALHYPVFTTIEETEEDYRNSVSWMTIDFTECCRATLADEDLAGIVINGFSNPLELNRKILQLVVNAK